MRSNSKHSEKELEKYIHMYLNEGVSVKELIKAYGLKLHERTFTQKVLKYQEHGLRGIQTNHRNNHYSKTFKEAVIKEHLEEGIPVAQLARKYKIPAHETVRNWIIKYTKGEKNKELFSKTRGVYDERQKNNTRRKNRHRQRLFKKWMVL